MPKQEFKTIGMPENSATAKQSALDIISDYIKDVRSRTDALEIIKNRMPWDELTADESYKIWDFFMWFKMLLRM